MSAQPCGCDSEARYQCERHLGMPLIEADRRFIAADEPYVEASKMRSFGGGATRNVDLNKFDYEGFLNPEALHAFGKYMHEHRHQRDGSLRDSDNWQKGIPLRVYVKSLVRHVIDLWRMERGYDVMNPDTGKPHTREELCCAITFNSLGYLKELVDPAPVNKEAA